MTPPQARHRWRRAVALATLCAFSLTTTGWATVPPLGGRPGVTWGIQRYQQAHGGALEDGSAHRHPQYRSIPSPSILSLLTVPVGRCWRWMPAAGPLAGPHSSLCRSDAPLAGAALRPERAGAEELAGALREHPATQASAAPDISPAGLEEGRGRLPRWAIVVAVGIVLGLWRTHFTAQPFDRPSRPSRGVPPAGLANPRATFPPTAIQTIQRWAPGFRVHRLPRGGFRVAGTARSLGDGSYQLARFLVTVDGPPAAGERPATLEVTITDVQGRVWLAGKDVTTTTRTTGGAERFDERRLFPAGGGYQFFLNVMPPFQPQPLGTFGSAALTLDARWRSPPPAPPAPRAGLEEKVESATDLPNREDQITSLMKHAEALLEAAAIPAAHRTRSTRRRLAAIVRLMDETSLAVLYLRFVEGDTWARIGERCQIQLQAAIKMAERRLQGVREALLPVSTFFDPSADWDFRPELARRLEASESLQAQSWYRRELRDVLGVPGVPRWWWRLLAEVGITTLGHLYVLHPRELLMINGINPRAIAWFRRYFKRRHLEWPSPENTVEESGHTVMQAARQIWADWKASRATALYLSYPHFQLIPLETMRRKQIVVMLRQMVEIAGAERVQLVFVSRTGGRGELHVVPMVPAESSYSEVLRRLSHFQMRVGIAEKPSLQHTLGVFPKLHPGALVEELKRLHGGQGRYRFGAVGLPDLPDQVTRMHQTMPWVQVDRIAEEAERIGRYLEARDRSRSIVEYRLELHRFSYWEQATRKSLAP